MTTTRATIGIDVGTSAVKGLLVGLDGVVLATASRPYPLLTPAPGWTEQEPEQWWQATVSVLAELARRDGIEVVALGLAGQMHGSVFLDADDQVIRPALLWNDGRTGDQVRQIEQRIGRATLIRITGNAASAGMQAPKILWLQQNESEAFSRVRKVLLPKDFVRLRLTGSYVTDPADASGTLLFDLAERHWSSELLQTLDIPREWLPEVMESPEMAGRLTAEAAALTGLPTGLPVAAGAGDNAGAALGAGVVRPGQGVLSIGTSGTIFVHGSEAMRDPNGALNGFCAAVPGGWHLMGVILAAGGALRWYADAVAADQRREAQDAQRDVYDLLLEQASAVPEGADGLFFLPYLSGERSPHMDASARGAWIGLTLSHERRHLVRALLEGVGFAFRDCLVRMQAEGAEFEQFVAVGGGARSDAWRQMLANQLGLPLAVPTAEEGPAMGGAILATVAAGCHPDVATAVDAMIKPPSKRTMPDPAIAARYAELHAGYAKLYPALAAAR
ncbi:MAG TPA: xylulokinase [Geminicoccus sp.]|jgi:xylulokinase|uniref:xylulokinase n=1 Tax=Geminicoccus sp. TaxID=2024832 RepID=UPI002E354AB2|nr:xylulokinase [Geminicoccus sp.]HEX2529039.1 xylulokinase [Geminicoccus sp.]